MKYVLVNLCFSTFFIKLNKPCAVLFAKYTEIAIKFYNDIYRIVLST